MFLWVMQWSRNRKEEIAQAVKGQEQAYKDGLFFKKTISLKTYEAKNRIEVQNKWWSLQDFWRTEV